MQRGKERHLVPSRALPCYSCLESHASGQSRGLQCPIPVVQEQCQQQEQCYDAGVPGHECTTYSHRGGQSKQGIPGLMKGTNFGSYKVPKAPITGEVCGKHSQWNPQLLLRSRLLSPMAEPLIPHADHSTGLWGHG